MKKDNINKKIDYLVKTVGHLTETTDNLTKTVGHLTETVDFLKETVDFVKDNAVTKQEFDKRSLEVDARFTKIEALMVTKDYLDDKLADLRGDLVVMTRKEDTKVKCLVEILHKKKLLTAGEAKQIFKMEPFAQIA